MIAPPLGVKPDTPCIVLHVGKERPTMMRTMPDGSKRQVRAHRAIYAAVHGWKAVEGKVVEHACDNPMCVRYGHLRLGTQTSNMADRDLKRRQWNAAKTHCKNGHEFTDENTRIRSGGNRACRECSREYQREWMRNRRRRR